MRTGTVKLVSPKPEALKLSEKTATLVHITTAKIAPRERTYGMYSIPSCKAGQRYVALKIRPARGVIQYGAGKRSEYEITAAEIAEDLARECNSEIWGIGSDVTGEVTTDSATGESEVVRGFAGIFVADADEPTEDELEQAEALLASSDEILATRGHENWDQFHRPDSIHDGFKRSARRLGVNADWLYAISQAPNCPHCGSKLKSPTATVCATCHRDVPAQAKEKPAAGKKPAGKKTAAAA
jgi:hypothetical protein